MAATWQWSGTYGASPGTTTDLGASGNLFNFKSVDSLTSAADYTSYPITAGNNSYEVWLRGHWSGTFNQIQNVQFYKSAGVLSGGIDIQWDGETTAYSTPVSSASTIATSNIPTADPGTANVSIGGALTGSLTAAGFSDYFPLQMQTKKLVLLGETLVEKFLKLRETLVRQSLLAKAVTRRLIETIRRQINRKLLRASTTIIGKPLCGLWDGLNSWETTRSLAEMTSSFVKNVTFLTTAAAAGDTPTCKSMGRDTAMCSGNLVNSEDTSKETIPSQQDRNIWACVETRDQAPLLERVESIVRTIWRHIELAGNMLVYNLNGL